MVKLNKSYLPNCHGIISVFNAEIYIQLKTPESPDNFTVLLQYTEEYESLYLGGDIFISFEW